MVVVAAVQQTVPVRLQAIGNVEAYTSVAVKSRVDGQILEVHFREGQEVKKGEVLFRIDARPFEAALRQAEAQTQRDIASRDQAASQERRYQELLDKNFVSKDAYAQYRTNAQTADATSKGSQAALENAKLNLEYTVIRSPIDGYVGRALLQAGNMVKANDTGSLVVLNQLRPIYVAFALPQGQLPRVRQAMAVGPLTVSTTIPGDSGPPLAGGLTFVDNAVDSSTGTIQLRATFDNAETRLWPGQFVNVTLTLRTDPAALVVPDAAIQHGQNGAYVFVVRPDSTVEMRPVVVDRSVAGESVIASGLSAGESVVVEGQLRLAPGMKVEPHPAGKAPAAGIES